MQRLQVSYDGSPSSVPQARHAVERALATWGLDALTWPAALLVSELAANALLHARTAFTVTLTALPEEAARLEVADGSSALPRPRDYGRDATTGRGLRLVEDLSSRWGVERSGSGKTVWVELAAAPGARSGSRRAERDDDDDVDALLLAFPDLDDGPVSATVA